MSHGVLKIHYDAPIEQVWELGMVDVAHMAQWQAALAEVKDLHGPMDQVGATATMVLKWPGRLRECRVEVVAAERPRLWSIVGHEVGGGLEFTSTSHLTPAQEGTDGEWEQNITLPSGLVGAFIDRVLVQPALERQMRQSKEKFKAILKMKALQPV